MSPAQGSPERPTLATDEQLAAERMLPRLLAHPDVAEAMRRLRAELEADPSAATPDARAWLDRAVALYAGSLAMREIGADPARPQALRDLDPGPPTWFGVPGTARGTSGESPDNIYRFLSLDGRYSYRLSGRVPANGPIHFSLDARAAPARRPPGHPAPPGRSDSGIQLGLMTEKDIQVGDDGAFTITIDTTPAAGRTNHLQIADGPATVLLRNVFSDWRQAPTHFRIERTDGLPTPPAPSEDQLASRLAEDLRAWARYWFDLPHTFLGAPPANTFPPPVPRDGGWGRLTACNFRLAPDEAMVVTTLGGGAAYTGAQVLGPWMLPPDPQARFVSRNISQVERDRRGRVTYVVSPVDTGAPNWLDSLGLGQGVIIFRWSAFAEPPPAELIESVQVVKLNDLGAALPSEMRRVTRVEREAELGRRVRDYQNRNLL
jgi:hypothetical protein